MKLKSDSKKHSTLVIGEVIGIFINDAFLDKDRVNSTAIRFIARMGYSKYITISSNFRIKRAQKSYY